jgi:hypothetical protein
LVERCRRMLAEGQSARSLAAPLWKVRECPPVYICAMPNRPCGQLRDRTRKVRTLHVPGCRALGYFEEPDQLCEAQ